MYDKERYLKNREKLLSLQKNYYQKNREKILIYHDKYREDNPDTWKEWYQKNKLTILSSKRKYYQENKEQEKERRRIYYSKNKDKEHESYNKWRKNNLDKDAARVRKRESLKQKSIPLWADLKQIAIYYEIAALYSELYEPYHVHHIVPLNGKNVRGFHSEDNLCIVTEKEHKQIHKEMRKLYA